MNATNEQRSSRAQAALEKVIDATGDADLESAVSDLLADLMHLCRDRGIAFQHKLSTATAHYNDEANASEAYEAKLAAVVPAALPPQFRTDLGDQFHIRTENDADGDRYVLASVGQTMALLVNRRSGTRWGAPQDRANLIGVPIDTFLTNAKLKGYGIVVEYLGNPAE